MRSFASVLLTCILAIPLTAQRGPIVSAAWLMEHIDEPDIVVLHVASSRRDFSSGHIPGARFLWWGDIAPSTPDYATEIPAVEDAQRVLRSLGVNTNSRIIVAFGGRSITSGTRTLFTLQYFGLGDRSWLLDGGVEAWKDAGGKISEDTPAVEDGDIVLEPYPSFIADRDFVKGNRTGGDVMIIDARSKAFYDGRPAAQPRGGHVGGAKSIPYSEVVDSLYRFKTDEDLRSLFWEAGVNENATVVTYCHIGQQATVTLLAARLLGHPVKLYDGSFEEWGYLDDENYPVEKAEGKE